jgi:hypothetical protein
VLGKTTAIRENQLGKQAWAEIDVVETLGDDI